MCLSIKIDAPERVLAEGIHNGHEWIVVHNDRGYRCGYVKVNPGHPWHGKSFHELRDVVRVHGNVTFTDEDTPCDADGSDNGWWIGFDCSHNYDAPDPALPNASDPETEGLRAITNLLGAMFGAALDGEHVPGEPVRSQEYVEAQCFSLADQCVAAIVH